MFNKMDILSKLIEIGVEYQKLLEESTMNFPSGSCYLSAFCLTKYFNNIGISAKVIVGEHALINVKDKYIIYGEKLKLKKSLNVGDYHAWCEIEMGEISYIIDPSVKYNSIFLKKHHNFKVSKKVPEVIATENKLTYQWKYIENESLKHFYEHFISDIPESFIEKIVIGLENSHPTL